MWIKIIGTIVVITGLLFGTLGCEETGTTDAGVTAAQFNALKAVVDRLAGREAIWDAYAASIKTLNDRPSGGGSSSTFDPSTLNTKDISLQTQIDTMKDKNTPGTLQAQIDALTTKINNQTVVQTSNPPNYSNPVGSTGNIPQFTPGTNPNSIPTSPGGGVVSQVNFVGGYNQLSSYPGGSNNIYYVQRLMNQNTAIQYVKPIITLSTASNLGWSSGYASENITAITIQLTTSMCTITGSANINAPAPYIYTPVDSYLIKGTGGNFNVIPGLGTSTSNIQITPASGCMTNTGELYLSPGGYTDISVQISNLITTPGGIWNINPSCSYHP